MNRGYFDFIAQNEVYSGAEKHWIVNLEWSKCYWYDLVAESPDFVGTRKEIKCHLKELVFSSACNERFGMDFMVLNSMIDEIPTELEGRIIEGTLIRYFKCASQEKDRKAEFLELENNLESLAESSHIHSVGVHLAVESPNEYFVFGSENIAAAAEHIFHCHKMNGHFTLERLSSKADLLSRARSW